MELETRFINGSKYVEFTINSGNTKVTSGFLNKFEAQLFVKQFTDIVDNINDMPEIE